MVTSEGGTLSSSNSFRYIKINLICCGLTSKTGVFFCCAGKSKLIWFEKHCGTRKVLGNELYSQSSHPRNARAARTTKSVTHSDSKDDFMLRWFKLWPGGVPPVPTLFVTWESIHRSTHRREEFASLSGCNWCVNANNTNNGLSSCREAEKSRVG